MTSFITLFGSYCYVTMQSGLKNSGVSYQRCRNRCLVKLIKEIVEVCIDNIIIKSKKADQLFGNLKEMSRCLCEFKIKVNTEKCIFMVPKGKLLGFFVSEGGNKANSEKIAVIRNLYPISNLKGIQNRWGECPPPSTI